MPLNNLPGSLYIIPICMFRYFKYIKQFSDIDEIFCKNELWKNSIACSFFCLDPENYFYLCDCYRLIANTAAPTYCLSCHHGPNGSHPPPHPHPHHPQWRKRRKKRKLVQWLLFCIMLRSYRGFFCHALTAFNQPVLHPSLQGSHYNHASYRCVLGVYLIFLLWCIYVHACTLKLQLFIVSLDLIGVLLHLKK